MGKLDLDTLLAPELRPSLTSRSALVAWSLVIALVLTLTLSGWNVAHAQRAVEVTPAVLLHEAPAGGQADAVFTVTNPMDVPIRVRVYLADWHYLGDGSPNYLAGGTLPRSLAPFTTFNPAEVLLEPGASSEVRYTVELPEDVNPGSYWGVLFLEAEEPDPEPGFELARFNVRVGHVVYVNVPPLEPAGMIGGIFGEPPSAPDDAYTLSIEYLNSGNAVQRLDGYVELRDGNGEVLFRESLPSEVSLPGDAVGRTFDIFGPLDPGPYTALVVYNYGDDTVDVAADYTFNLEQALVEPTTPEPEAEVQTPNEAGDADAATDSGDATEANAGGPGE